MGKIKHLDRIEEFIDKTKAFSVKDIKRFLISNRANPNYAYTILHILKKKGKIYRIVKGYYSKYDDPMVITYCIKPSYIGLENALSLHGLWEQETNVILITPRRLRFGIRKVLGANVVIHHISKEHFFGYEYMDYYDLKIPVSDTEKTFIDWIYYYDEIDKDLLELFDKKINRKRLKEYLKNYDNRFAKKVQDILSRR